MNLMKSTLLAACAAFLCVLNLAAEPLKVGDKAPDFSLQGSDGKTYKLSDLKGKPVVIAWYPKAFTPGCTTQCKAMSAGAAELKKHDAHFFTASVDDAETNKKFSESTGGGYPILSDPTKETAKAYGVLNDRGMANRWTFYIDKDGKIAHIDNQVKPADYDKTVAAKLKELSAKK